MNTPEWTKFVFFGALIGAIFVGVIGFTWGRWVTDGIANQRAMSISRDGVIVSMVPMCLEMARSDPSRADKMEKIRSTSTYQRRDAHMTAGWTTMPGTDAPNRDIAQACLAALDIAVLPERSKSMIDEG